MGILFREKGKGKARAARIRGVPLPRAVRAARIGSVTFRRSTGDGRGQRPFEPWAARIRSITLPRDIRGVIWRWNTNERYNLLMVPMRAAFIFDGAPQSNTPKTHWPHRWVSRGQATPRMCAAFNFRQTHIRAK